MRVEDRQVYSIIICITACASAERVEFEEASMQDSSVSLPLLDIVSRNCQGPEATLRSTIIDNLQPAIFQNGSLSRFVSFGPVVRSDVY